MLRQVRVLWIHSQYSVFLLVLLPAFLLYYRSFPYIGNNIDRSDSYKTFLCHAYDIPVPKFCHFDGNWIMLPNNTYLLWVPNPYKSGLLWPRTTTVMGCTPVSLLFKDFVHDKSWSQCFLSHCRKN